MVWLVKLPELVELLRTHGLTLVEYRALAPVAHEVPLGLSAMARHANHANVVPVSQQPTFSEAEYAAALESLIARGILTLAPAYTKENARMRQEGLIRRRWLVPATGSIVFTPRGFRFYQALAVTIHGPRQLGMTMERSLGPRSMEVIHIAPTMRESRDWMVESEANARTRGRDWRFDQAVLVACYGPERVGPWRRDMFTVVPRGSRVRLRLRVER